VVADPSPTKDDFFEEDSDGARFRVGDLIGERYQLLECIGVGAMGTVFRAHDRVLDASLALKLIRIDPQHTNTERATHRLLLEARAIARISHPGIVRVFDFGCVKNVPFIAMELLRGESLLDFAEREGPVEPLRAVRMLLPVADAISVAHRRGVVHRDIKPENVILAKDEFSRIQPKVVDFGVARLRVGGAGLTRPGALLGTPDYMAPEQAQGEPDVDQRADVFAFAVVLYELLTQRRPFSHGKANYLSVLKAVVSEPARPLIDFGVDEPELWSIIARALEKSRDARWQTLRAMAEALAFWLLDKGVYADAYGASLRSTYLVGDPEVEPTLGSGERESSTLRRVPADPVVPVASAPDDAEPPTLPPPALLAAEPAGPSELPSAFPLATVLQASGEALQGPKTIESAPSRPLSSVLLALASALVGAATTAGWFWLHSL
jgi:serine/threonine protein kinase